MEAIERQIIGIKKKLQEIGDMRPGSLTKQSYKRGDSQWPYWQISYTHKKKSRTEYVRDEFVKNLKKEVAEYKKFKTLTTKWVDVAIILSKERIKMEKSLRK